MHELSTMEEEKKMGKKSMLFNPKTFTGEEYDVKSRKAMLDTIAFFEKKGLKSIRDDEKGYIWQDRRVN